MGRLPGQPGPHPEIRHRQGHLQPGSAYRGRTLQLGQRDQSRFDRPDSPTIGVEFVGTSITSDGDGFDTRSDIKRILDENPHIKFFNGQRGYVRCTVTPDTWRTDYRVLPYVSRPDAPISTRATFVVENGRPGLRRADGGSSLETIG